MSNDKQEQYAVRSQREPGWFWMDNEILDDYAPLIGTRGVALYAAIARSIDNGTQRTWKGQKSLGELADIKSPATISDALRDLYGYSLIEIEWRYDEGKTNLIIMLEPLPVEDAKKRYPGRVSEFDRGVSEINTRLSKTDRGVSKTGDDQDSVPPSEPDSIPDIGADAPLKAVTKRTFQKEKWPVPYGTKFKQDEWDAIGARIQDITGVDPNASWVAFERATDYVCWWGKLSLDDHTNDVRFVDTKLREFDRRYRADDRFKGNAPSVFSLVKWLSPILSSTNGHRATTPAVDEKRVELLRQQKQAQGGL